MSERHVRLIQNVATLSTGAGGTAAVAVTVPFAKKWRLIGGLASLDESGKIIAILGHDIYLAYKLSNTSGIKILYPSTSVEAAGGALLTQGAVSPQWLKAGSTIYFAAYATSASKTLTYAYSVEEFADDERQPDPT